MNDLSASEREALQSWQAKPQQSGGFVGRELAKRLKAGVDTQTEILQADAVRFVPADEPLPPYVCRTPPEGMSPRAVVRVPTFHIDQETRGLVQDGYLDVRNPDPDDPIDGGVFILAKYENGEFVVAIAGVN